MAHNNVALVTLTDKQTNKTPYNNKKWKLLIPTLSADDTIALTSQIPSVEAGAQVNIIETIKRNGVALIPTETIY